MLQDWQEDYQGNLLVILPDTYGTTNFLKHAPDWVASWTGIRIDSKDPIEGGEEAIDWWLSRGQNPHEKLAIFSDGLDVDTIIDIHRQFHGRVRVGYGWGTLLTNDFRGLAPNDGARADLDRLQGALGERPAGGQDLRQPDEGDRAEGRDRALQAGVRRRRADGAAGAGVSGERRACAAVIPGRPKGRTRNPWRPALSAIAIELVRGFRVLASRAPE